MLTLDAYVPKDGQPYCSTCHIRLFSNGPVFQKPVYEETWVDDSRPSVIATTVIKVETVKCTVCDKNVYKAEEVIAGGRVWHKTWFEKIT